MPLRLCSPPSPPLPSLSSSRRSPTPSHLPRRPLPQYHASKKREASFTDRILDYIEGGPKLRRWYGAPDLLPKDGGPEDEEAESSEMEEARDAVLVTDGDSEVGQMVILSLILKRTRIKALVKSKQASIDAFGTYVEPLVGDTNGQSFLKKALRGVRAVICPSHDGFFSRADMKGVQHVVLLSQLAAYRGSSGLQAIMNSNLKLLAERDEEAVIAAGIPYTIVRIGFLQDTPGGLRGFSFKEGVAGKGKISKEDAAKICVEALEVVPPKGIIVEVINGEEEVPDWKEWFSERIRNGKSA